MYINECDEIVVVLSGKLYNEEIGLIYKGNSEKNYFNFVGNHTKYCMRW